MIPTGSGWYALTINGDDLPNLAQGTSEAWLDLQFVANDANNQPIARSTVIRQVTYKRCFN